MVRVAIEGCCHGDLDKIYATLEYAQQINPDQPPIDLLICCGDFQAIRNEKDLECMNTPPKYRLYKDFYRYYSGEKRAFVPTIFIGGNHEASNHLRELYYGGYVAPDIYYIGHSGVVNFKGLRIAGISGIYNANDYFRKRDRETLPYNEKTIRSAYHLRHFETYKTYQLQLSSDPIDIFLSHDWPVNITDYGDVQKLLLWKQHFRNDIEKKQLGSPPAQMLLRNLRPSYWFSGHMHCKFTAIVPHKCTNTVTKFLALDKCLPKRNFLQILDIEPASGQKVDDNHFYYDLDWLAITRLTNDKMNVQPHLYGSHIDNVQLISRDVFDQEKGRLQEHLQTYKDGKYASLKIAKENFIRNAPVYDPKKQFQRHNESVKDWNFLEVKNPQTLEFLHMLELPDLISFTPQITAQHSSSSAEKNDEEIELDI